MKRYASYALCLPLTAALLAACGGGTVITDPIVPVAVPITTVNGKVDRWTGSASTVELLAQPFGIKSATNPALASATLNANGTFALTLPSLATITPYLSVAANPTSLLAENGASCTGALTNSDPSSQAYIFGGLNSENRFLLSSQNVITNKTSTEATVSTNAKLWIYVTKPTTLGGSATCNSTDSLSGFTFVSNISANAPLVQGWNILALTSTTVSLLDKKSATSTDNFTAISDGPSTWYLQ